MISRLESLIPIRHEGRRRTLQLNTKIPRMNQSRSSERVFGTVRDHPELNCRNGIKPNTTSSFACYGPDWHPSQSRQVSCRMGHHPGRKRITTSIRSSVDRKQLLRVRGYAFTGIEPLRILCSNPKKNGKRFAGNGMRYRSSWQDGKRITQCSFANAARSFSTWRNSRICFDGIFAILLLNS